MNKKELIKQFEYSVETKDAINLKVKVQIHKDNSGYLAVLSHEFINTPIGSNLEGLYAANLSDIEFRVEKYLSAFKDVNMKDIYTKK